jgi:hypothetical protein
MDEYIIYTNTCHPVVTKMKVNLSNLVEYQVYEGKDIVVLARKISDNLFKVIMQYDEEEEEHFIEKSTLDELKTKYEIDKEATDTETRLEKTSREIDTEY